jgi:heme/copper-type cytochrome/quinol oxidase subunit 2
MTEKIKNILFSSRGKLIIGAIIAVIIVVIIVLIQINNSEDKVETIAATPEEITQQEEADNMPIMNGDEYRREIPQNIVVPDMETKLTAAQKKEIALPKIVTPAAPGVDTSFRSFDIKADKGLFTPNKIIANLGDTIRINFTAVDKTYDVVFPSYDMQQTAKKGQTKILQFQAVAEGSFLYYCDSCGGDTSKTKGNIIIVK